jgi:acetate kinase
MDLARLVAPASVLVVNAGSSSLKLRLLGAADEVVASRDLEPTTDSAVALSEFIGLAGEPDAFGHRIVHGGTEFTEPTRLDRRVDEKLAALSELAPLHNPPALAIIEAATRLRPEVPQIACFDTAFHATIPAEAYTYAIPVSWSSRWPLRRFGFHGLSHSHAARRGAELLGRPPESVRLVTAHLGSGASLAAIEGGRSIDTTMGFTPLDGLVMATRSGSVDPGLVLWAQRRGGTDAETTERALDREAGLLALSQRSGDMREVLAGIAEGNEHCRLAFDVYSHRLAAGVASMATALGGLDGLVFTGGVGENSPEIRAEAVRRLSYLGLELDPALNADAVGDAVLSRSGEQPGTVVVIAREDLEIAAGVRTVLT